MSFQDGDRVRVLVHQNVSKLLHNKLATVRGGPLSISRSWLGESFRIDKYIICVDGVEPRTVELWGDQLELAVLETLAGIQ